MSAQTLIRRVTGNKLKLFFFVGWFLLNLLQAGLTELFDDEAYYWAYSNYPAWGYFDHPPMIAVFIKAGYFFFRNELGVRLFSVIAGTGIPFVIQALLPQKNDRLFYAIILCLAVLQICGFISIPDIPLIFFTALFFLLYRRFLLRPEPLNILLLGLITALMLYSKYQGVLVVFFTLLSNPRLLLKYQTYAVAAVALLCFFPHIYWEYRHNFISLEFQLIDRHIGKSFSPAFTAEYLGGQILFAGPFAGLLLIWASFAYRARNLYEKALKYTLTGCYVFFLLMTLQDRVELNWTAPVLVPLVVLSHSYYNTRPGWGKWLFRLAPLTLICVLVLRIYLVLEVAVPGPVSKLDEVHGNPAMAAAIQNKAKGHPVIFLDSYQKASKYWFYAGQPSFSLNTVHYRRNNYNLWPLEDPLYNKPVYVVGRYDRLLFKDSVSTSQGLQGGLLIPHYFSLSGINIQFRKMSLGENGPGWSIKCSDFLNQLPELLSLSPAVGKEEIQLWIRLSRNKNKIIHTGICLDELASGKNHFIKSPIRDVPSGKYLARFAIPSAVPEMPAVNSGYIKLNLTAK